MTVARELVTYMLIKTNDEDLKKTQKNIDETKNKFKQADDERKKTEKERIQEERKLAQEEERMARERERRENARQKRIRNNFLVLSGTMGLMTKEAVKFERVLADIAKVNPHINLKEAEKTLFNMSKYASGKSLTDLGLAYKTYAQTLRNQGDIEGMMKLTEKGSIAYDMSAAQTATALSIIRNNLNMTNKDVETLGDKIAYAHHNYGNAQVPDIFAALQDMSGVMRTSGINETFGTAYATIGLNAGFEASEVARSMQRLNQRTMMGEFWAQRGAFQKAGEEAGINMVKFTDDLLKASKTGDTGKEWVKLFTQISEAQKQGKNVSAIWSIIGGLNYERIFKAIGSQLPQFLDLLEKLSGNVRRNDGKAVYEGEQERAYQIVMATTSKQIEQLGNAMQRLSKTLAEGNLPALNAGIKGLVKGIDTIVDSGFGGAIGKSLMAYISVVGGAFLVNFAKKHAQTLMTSLVPFAGPVGRLATVLVTISPILLKLAEALGERLAKATPQERMKEIEADMHLNKLFNTMTPVDMNNMSVKGLANGTQTAEQSFYAGLFSDKYRQMRGGTLDVNGYTVKTGGMTLVQNVNVNAEYSQLQNQIDAEKANDDLVNKIMQKAKDNSSQFSDSQFNRISYDLRNSI